MNPNTPGQQPFQPNPSGVPPQQQSSPFGGYSQPQPQQPPQPQMPNQPQFAQQPSPFAPSAPAPAPAQYSSGRPSKRWQILTAIFVATTLIGAGLGVWALVNYIDQKDNVDSKVALAVADAVKTQADEDAASFLEKEKQPNRQFAGPDDYGHLTFDYPKTWSVYVDKDALSGGTYEAYLNPAVVPPVSANERYALRVTIAESDYDKVVEDYKSLVTKGDLQSAVFKIDEENNGTRLNGNFTKDIRGSAVIFKIRDKTVTLRTDAETFTADFEALIATIAFNM